jgi:hypothetical protein
VNKKKRLTYFCNSDAFVKICFTFVHCLLPMKNNFVARKSDWIGILGSMACLIHCLALPALFYFFQFTSGFHQTSVGHLLEYAFMAVATVAVVTTVKKSTSTVVKILLIFSLSLFISGILLESSFSFSVYLLHLGSLGLITGHTINIRQQHRSRFPLQTRHAPAPETNEAIPATRSLPTYPETVASQAC